MKDKKLFDDLELKKEVDEVRKKIKDSGLDLVWR